MSRSGPLRQTRPMAELLVVSGPPGVGKSTVARAIADQFDPSVLVVGDAFFGFVHNGFIPPWMPKSHDQNAAVTEAAAAAAGRFVRHGFATVYDGVLGPWLLDRFLAVAAVPTADYVVLLPSLDRCLERIRTRRDHPFDDEVAAIDLHAQWTDAVIDGRQVLDRRHVLDNGDHDVDATVELIGAGVAEGRWTVGLGS